jgi:hypothetical protein
MDSQSQPSDTYSSLEMAPSSNQVSTVWARTSIRILGDITQGLQEPERQLSRVDGPGLAMDSAKSSKQEFAIAQVVQNSCDAEGCNYNSQCTGKPATHRQRQRQTLQLRDVTFALVWRTNAYYAKERHLRRLMAECALLPPGSNAARSREGRHQQVGQPQPPQGPKARFIRYRESAACITVMRWHRRLKNGSDVQAVSSCNTAEAQPLRSTSPHATSTSR